MAVVPALIAQAALLVHGGHTDRVGLCADLWLVSLEVSAAILAAAYIFSADGRLF